MPIESVDDMRVTPEEVNILLTEGAKLAPALATTRILRAYEKNNCIGVIVEGEAFVITDSLPVRPSAS